MLPRSDSGGQPLSFNVGPVNGRVFRLLFDHAGARSDQVVISDLIFRRVRRIENWPAKAAFRREPVGLPSRDTDSGADGVIPRGAVVDITDRLTAEGRLDWRPPPGEWTVLRFGYTPTGKANHPAPAAGRGLECDKMSRQAVSAFYSGMMATVIDEAGSLAGNTLSSTLIDSYEVGSQNWTPGFRAAFLRRRGYDLLVWLPAVTGRVVESLAVSERLLWDWRQTIGDLFRENYFDHFGQISRRHGLQLSVEAYGNGPFDNLAVAECADIPMSEFWTSASLRTHGYDTRAKEAASASHTLGKRVVGAEAFTASRENGMWQNHPYLLKAQGDAEFCSGVNRLIFHRYAHQPWVDRVPGMTMGPWGFHIERTNTWWTQGRAWLAYLSRCQYLLQKGVFVADVLYWAGEGVPNSLPARRALTPRLPDGCDYDGCSTRLLFEGLTVHDGRLRVPSGTTYRYLVLPDRPCMTPEAVLRVGDLVKAGATVIGPRPMSSPSLTDYPACDLRVAQYASEIWGDCDGEEVTQHDFGRGRIIWGRSRLWDR